MCRLIRPLEEASLFPLNPFQPPPSCITLSFPEFYSSLRETVPLPHGLRLFRMHNVAPFSFWLKQIDSLIQFYGWFTSWVFSPLLTRLPAT